VTARAWLLPLALAAGLSGCAHGGAAGKRGIYLDCDVPGANVFVDDFYLQHAFRWREQPMPLRPGFHRIQIVADGYYTYYGEVTVRELGFEKVTVHLRKALE
jgi:hypothetical protein